MLLVTILSPIIHTGSWSPWTVVHCTVKTGPSGTLRLLRLSGISLMDNPFTIELLVMDGPLDPTLRTEITSSDIDVKQIMMLMLRNVKPSLKAPTVLSTSQIG